MNQVEEIIKQYVQKNYAEYFERLKISIVPKELILHQNGEAGIDNIKFYLNVNGM